MVIIKNLNIEYNRFSGFRGHATEINMKTSYHKQLQLNILFVIILSIILSSNITQAATSESESTQPSDSANTQPQPMPNRTTWETIAYIPGQIIYLPLKYTFKGLSIGIGYVDDSKIVQRVNDFLSTDDGRRGVKPTYASSTGAGIIFYQKGLFDTPSNRNILNLTVSGWDLQRQRYQATLENIAFANADIATQLRLRYHKLPTESFFGIGPNSLYDDESNYTLEQTIAQAAVGKKLNPNLTVEAQWAYQYTTSYCGRDPKELSTTELYSPSILPGLSQEIEMVHGTVSLNYQSHNRPGHPSKGMDLSLSGGLYQQINQDQFGFWKHAADVTWYQHIIYDRVLALRIAGEMTTNYQDRDIPFYSLSELGSTETIRGFDRGRFWDRDMVMASLEYRYPIWAYWHKTGVDFVWFVDTGLVSPDILNEFDAGNFQTGVGCGLRLWNLDGLAVKIEVAKSKDRWRVHFVLN